MIECANESARVGRRGEGGGALPEMNARKGVVVTDVEAVSKVISE